MSLTFLLFLVILWARFGDQLLRVPVPRLKVLPRPEELKGRILLNARLYIAGGSGDELGHRAQGYYKSPRSYIVPGEINWIRKLWRMRIFDAFSHAEIRQIGADRSCG
jgi:hypothetical protein